MRGRGSSASAPAVVVPRVDISGGGGGGELNEEEVGDNDVLLLVGVRRFERETGRAQQRMQVLLKPVCRKTSKALLPALHHFV